MLHIGRRKRGKQRYVFFYFSISHLLSNVVLEHVLNVVLEHVSNVVFGPYLFLYFLQVQKYIETYYKDHCKPSAVHNEHSEQVAVQEIYAICCLLRFGCAKPGICYSAKKTSCCLQQKVAVYNKQVAVYNK